MEVCPDGIDFEQWTNFRNKYFSANNLEEHDFPPQIDIELNSSCNMTCPFCIHGYGERPKSELTLEQFKTVVNEAVKEGARGLKLNYINEPMLRKDFEACISYAKQAGMLNVYFVTNGTLLTKTRRDRLLNSGVTKVFISVDATTEEIYNKQRLSGKFKKVVSNVNALIDERNALDKRYPLIRVSFLINQINQHQENEFRNAWSGRADLIAFQKMNELPSEDTGLTIKLSDEELEKQRKEYRCSFPFKQLVIDSDGDISPCCKLGGQNLAIGNIKEMTLKEAWDCDQSKEFRTMHREGRWHENEICKRCIEE